MSYDLTSPILCFNSDHMSHDRLTVRSHLIASHVAGLDWMMRVWQSLVRSLFLSMPQPNQNTFGTFIKMGSLEKRVSFLRISVLFWNCRLQICGVTVTLLRIGDVRTIDNRGLSCFNEVCVCRLCGTCFFFCIFGVIFQIPSGWMLLVSVSIIEKLASTGRSQMPHVTSRQMNGSFSKKVGHLRKNNIPHLWATGWDQFLDDPGSEWGYLARQNPGNSARNTRKVTDWRWGQWLATGIWEGLESGLVEIKDRKDGAWSRFLQKAMARQRFSFCLHESLSRETIKENLANNYSI
jgi:hypothetical protein